MSIRIFFGLALLLTLSTGVAFAQESLISVQTDKNHYNEGDTIVISGAVTVKIGETPATLQLWSKDSLVEIAQITIAQDGSYSHIIKTGVKTEGPYWQKQQGEYIIRAVYGEGNIAEVTFNYSPKSQASSTTDYKDVDAGSHYGTFTVRYTIQGGTIDDIVVDSDIFALIVQIDSTDEGYITLDLPREFIGAEKQNSKDDTFIVLIDEINVAYQESIVLSDSRVITINFEQGDSEIKIIGTYVLPEFGTIAMMILVVGIITTIVITRNKLQITA